MSIKMPEQYWTGKGLLEKRIPWLTPGAVQFLANYIQPHHDALEFGAGGSTAFLADRCRQVHTWEINPVWKRRVKKELGEQVENVDWLDRFEAALQLRADIVLVDSDGIATDRQAIALQATRCVRDGGLFVLDNYGRYCVPLTPVWNVKWFNDPHWSGRGTLIAQLL